MDVWNQKPPSIKDKSLAFCAIRTVIYSTVLCSKRGFDLQAVLGDGPQPQMIKVIYKMKEKRVCVCVCQIYIQYFHTYNLMNLYTGASGSRAKRQLLPSCDGLPDKGEELGQRKNTFFTGPSGHLPWHLWNPFVHENFNSDEAKLPFPSFFRLLSFLRAVTSLPGRKKGISSLLVTRSLLL